MQVIKYIQLPFGFDAAKMQAEADSLATAFWKMHYNKKHYTGNWSIIPLRALNGDANIPYSVHATAAGNLPYADTPLLEQCPYIQEVIRLFLCEKTSIRLMKLDAGAVINTHHDQDMAYEQGEIRLHIPVSTNSDVAFFIEEERIPMQEGECWYLNLQLAHRVRNDGLTDRVHLVIDCRVNDWVHELFNNPEIAVKKMTTPIQGIPALSNTEKEKIIQELRRQNTPDANRVADALENPDSAG
jgi:hypothetical protein